MIGDSCRGVSTAYEWLSKLWSLFGSLLQYGTYHLGYPKRDRNFDKHPYVYSLFEGSWDQGWGEALQWSRAGLKIERNKALQTGLRFRGLGVWGFKGLGLRV